ncbi:helix-turn-helix domain-containing protein [Streptomyces sp. NPDC005722]
MLRIRGFIEQHLADPGLTPATVAAAHNISTRQLHRLFQAQNMAVAGWIRRRRLENCRRDLADPRYGQHTVQVVAARWGFTDKAHFSRLFRATYGMPPETCATWPSTSAVDGQRPPRGTQHDDRAPPRNRCRARRHARTTHPS